MTGMFEVKKYDKNDYSQWEADVEECELPDLIWKWCHACESGERLTIRCEVIP